MSGTRSLVDQPLTEQLLGLFSPIFGGCAGTARALVGRGSATKQYVCRPGDWAHLPDWLLQELAYAVPDDIRFTLASLDSGRGEVIVDVPCVWTEILQTPAMSRRTWVVPDDVRAAARARIDAFPLAPSFVINQRFNLLLIWLLDRPAARRFEAQLEQLQRALAIALGGRTELERVPRARASGGASYVELPAYALRRPVLRVPGSHNHERADDVPVRLLAADASRRYPLEQLIAAVQPAPAAAGRRDSAARFTGREAKESR